MGAAEAFSLSAARCDPVRGGIGRAGVYKSALTSHSWKIFTGRLARSLGRQMKQ